MLAGAPTALPDPRIAAAVAALCETVHVTVAIHFRAEDGRPRCITIQMEAPTIEVALEEIRMLGIAEWRDRR